MSTKNHWWNKDTDVAIIAFTKMRKGSKRDKLYTEKIHPAFIKLAALVYGKYGHRFKLNTYSSYDDFITEYVPELYQHLLTYKDRRKIISLYTYFFVLLKHMISNKIIQVHNGGESYRQKQSYIHDYETSKNKTINNLIYYPNYDSEIDMKMLINSICQTISGDIQNIYRKATIQEMFGIALIDYLQTTAPSDINWRDLRTHLKDKFPDKSKQYMNNLFRHFRDVIQKERSNVNAPKGTKYGDRGYKDYANRPRKKRKQKI